MEDAEIEVVKKDMLHKVNIYPRYITFKSNLVEMLGG